MAKTKNSILDGIRGRVGPLSFSVNKGGNYVKLRKKSVNPKTAAQVAQQNRFRNNAGGWNPLTQAIKQAWNTFATQTYNPLRRINKGQYSGVSAFKAIKGAIQNFNDKGISFSGTFDSGTPSFTLTTLSCQMPANAPIATVRPDIYDSAGVFYPISFLSGALASSGAFSISCGFIDVPSAGLTGANWKDENSLKIGFQVYISESIKAVGNRAQNPFNQCIGSTGIIGSSTPTLATHKGFQLAGNCSAFIPKFKKFPLTGNVVLMTVIVISENGTVSQCGSQYVTVT